MADHESFSFYLPDADDAETAWIGVLWTYLPGTKNESFCPFEICPRYSSGGRLECAGLRVGDGCYLRPHTNIGRRLLAALPVTEVLRYLQEHEDSNVLPSEVRRRLRNALPLELLLPPKGRAVAPGKQGYSDEFYIAKAELFAREARGGPRGNAALYRRLAAEQGYSESQFRRIVQKGLDLRPDLKPEGLRTRRQTP